MKRIMVTGGDGFLGQHIVRKLYQRGCYSISVPQHGIFDLRRRNDVQSAYKLYKPDIVIHAAAICGGIQACSANPGSFLSDNLTMNTEVLEGARESGVEKFVAISSVCAYPLNVALPAKEEDIWSGYPEETNAPYGIVKRVLLEQCKAYHKQYGMNCISLVPANMYGPGDHFDAARAHFIPSLIRKCVEAKEKNTALTVWGTGNASREFLYVKDCAEAIVLATEKYNDPHPVNVATGDEVSVRRVVEILTSLAGFDGPIHWDTTKPEGQPRRWFNTRRASRFGFKASTPLWLGLQDTMEWYKNEHGKS